MLEPSAQPAESPIAFGPFVLDPAGACVRRGPRVIPLRRKAWETLRYLVRRPGVLVSNDELLDAVWHGAAVTPQTLTNVIHELRTALDDRARAPRYLVTVYGRGHLVLPAPIARRAPGRRATTLRYLERAAARAEQRFAFHEAAACLRATLAYLGAPDDLRSSEREHAGQLALRLGSCLTLAASYSAEEVGDAFALARRLFAGDDASPGRFIAELGLARWSLTRAAYGRARVHTDHMLAMGRTTRPEFLAAACCWAGFSASITGELPRARMLLEEGSRATTAPPAGPGDVRRVIASQLGLVLTVMGDLAGGREQTARAIADGRASGDPGELAHACLVATECAVFARDHTTGRTTVREALALATDNGLRSFAHLARIYDAWLHDDRPVAERLAVMRDTIAERERFGDRWHRSMLLALVAEVELAAGDPGAARTTLDAAVAHVASTGERHYEAEIHRLRSACARAMNDTREATACARRALAVARRQRARLWTDRLAADAA